MTADSTAGAVPLPAIGVVRTGHTELAATPIQAGLNRAEHGTLDIAEPTGRGWTDMKVVREEIFGPVVVAAPFQSLDEIAAVANDTDYGLGAGIWTRDISKAHALAKKIRAGTVLINCYNVFDASLPFGGYKQSGWGREMGHEALEAYTEVKAVTTQL
jgi:phenylacetaldehyde dehydrogenase